MTSAIQAQMPIVAMPFRWRGFSDLLDTCFTDKAAVDYYARHDDMEFGSVDLAVAGMGAGKIEYFGDEKLRVVVMNCTYGQDVALRLVDSGWIRLNFSLDINIDMAFGSRDAVHLAAPSWRFVSVPPEEVTVETISAGRPQTWVTVCCRPDTLSHLDDGVLERQCDMPVAAQAGFAHRSYKFSTFLWNAVESLINFRTDGRLRSRYVAAKAQELLVLGVDSMRDAAVHDIEAPDRRLTERDVAAVRRARDLLEADLATAPSVAQLCRMVGLNRNKLSQGFRTLHGTSISDFLQQRRLATAHHLIRTTDLPIGEISLRVGFQHQCNFSTAFRTLYGMTPRDMRSGHSERPT